VTSNRPAWDDEHARKMIGARVLIGMTYSAIDSYRQEQVIGTIASVSASHGITVLLHGIREGEEFWLPPELAAFCAAPAGTYRLVTTEEVIKDPDLTTLWEAAENSITKELVWVATYERHGAVPVAWRTRTGDRQASANY
jgi:hypothetical protein